MAEGSFMVHALTKTMTYDDRRLLSGSNRWPAFACFHGGFLSKTRWVNPLNVDNDARSYPSRALLSPYVDDAAEFMVSPRFHYSSLLLVICGPAIGS